METDARLFNCARCHRQVVICSRCDRGNLYCGFAMCPVSPWRVRSGRRRALPEQPARALQPRGPPAALSPAPKTKVTHQGSPAFPPMIHWMPGRNGVLPRLNHPRRVRMNGSFVTFVAGSVRHDGVWGFDKVDRPSRTGSNQVQSGADGKPARGGCPRLAIGPTVKRRHHLGDHQRKGAVAKIDPIALSEIRSKMPPTGRIAGIYLLSIGRSTVYKLPNEAGE
jgi:hypothetical protein